MLQIILFEDHPQDRSRLETVLAHYFSSRRLSYTVRAFSEFCDDLSVAQNADLVFLDMEVNTQNGIAFGKRLLARYPDLTIIITSSHPQYLIDGYKINARRYFLKPVDPEIFAFEMDDVLASPAFSNEQGVLDARLAPYKIRFDDILFIEYKDRKTHVALSNGETLSTTIALKEWLGMLDGRSFAQPYKCFIVNLRFVRAIESRDVLVNDERIPLSKHFKASFQAALDYERRKRR